MFMTGAADDRGKNAKSHIKHDGLKKVLTAQLGMYRNKNDERVALCDAHAGDGNGVALPQGDLFDGVCLSVATAPLIVTMAERDGNADVFLCERNAAKRASLAAKFPGATILSDHAELPGRLIGRYRYAQTISDSCGPKEQGMECLRKIALMIPRADFFIVCNAFLLRDNLRDLAEPTAGSSRHYKAAYVTRERYAHLADLERYPIELNRKHMSATDEIPMSNRFKPRIMVVSNFLSDGAKRKPFKVIK
jgi:hypothetical protein